VTPSTRKPLRILVVEPWLGGSHRAFWNAWAERSEHSLEIVGLSPHHWKWRMRVGAWELARKVRKTPPPELLVVSDYLALPSFYGFLPEEWSRVPSLLYFHENQLTYPGSREVLDPDRDLQFGFTNILSCTRAAGVAFNSRFHRSDFENAARELLTILPRPNPRVELEAALRSARVIPPGVEMEELPLGPGAEGKAPLRVLFNHRWEHDKDPIGFLRAIAEARRRGARLELVLLGETFEKLPEGTAAALESIEEVILQRGFLPSRAEYVAQLGSCDLVVSTALHEFFGISVIEAMSAGATPLLPNRLSYPELVGEELSEEVLYEDEEQLVRRLVDLARDPQPLRDTHRRERIRAVAESWSIGPAAATLDTFCSELAESAS
jgi:glycosyltransferase involved in cell wall biosynthesis